MDLRDIKKYKGHMPLKTEKEDVLLWIGGLIGGEWLQSLWIGKYGGYHTVRYRFGDLNEVQIYMKNRTWLSVPLSLWLCFCKLDKSVLDESCWMWLLSQRSGLNIRHANVKSTSGDDFLST